MSDSDDWIECWQCNGIGKIAGCFEDTCVCTGDPDDPEDCCAPRRCDICKGNGFYPPVKQKEDEIWPEYGGPQDWPGDEDVP